jgi:hypothetical protein
MKVLCLRVVLWLLITNGVAGAAAGKRIAVENREILGITLGRSTTDDVKRVLGPAPIQELPPQGEMATSCYVSTGSDKTMLQFYVWFEPIRFRLSRSSATSDLSCTSSPLVSDKLGTRSGLKLGMLRDQVIKILGRPTKIDGGRLVYESSHDRPVTPDERKRRDKEGGPPWPVKSVHVDDRIVLEFVGSEVVSVDVLHNETD